MAIKNTKLDSSGADPGAPYRHILLEVPSNKRYAITTVMVCNSYDPGAVNADAQYCTFDMYLVPDGSTISPETTGIIRRLTIPAGETFTFDSEKIILEEYDRLVLDGAAPGHLVATVSYLEV